MARARSLAQFQITSTAPMTRIFPCGRQTSITAGTAMHRTKLPLTTWFWAAHLMATHSNGMLGRRWPDGFVCPVCGKGRAAALKSRAYTFTNARASRYALWPRPPRHDRGQYRRFDRSLREGECDARSHAAHRRPRILSRTDRLQARSPRGRQDGVTCRAAVDS